MSIVKQRISFQHQAPIRKTSVASTCFYASFLTRFFPFNSWFTHLFIVNTSLFTLDTYLLKQLYQVTQVPREFDTRFLPFYTTCTIWCTCRKRTSFWHRCWGTSFYFESLFVFRCLLFIRYSLIICEYLFSIHIYLFLLNWIIVVSVSILYAQISHRKFSSFGLGD